MIALDLRAINSDYYRGMDEELDSIPPARVPPNAFFAMEGGKTFPLDKAVINMGRMLDNDLVIDDPRVSRHHAQLRAVDGHFVLFDTNSTGGIFVNGRRITETIMYPHDTISLAGVVLTFHQDEPPPRPDLADTVQ